MSVEIFFSYSHKDEILRDELEKQLTLLTRQGLISSWHDRRIVAGQEWADEIDIHLNTAQIILLLVSPDFMASKYCYESEMQRAMERHEAREATVIPIILRPVDWQAAPFGKLQALPKDGKPVINWKNLDEAFLDIGRGMRKAVEDLNGLSSTTSKKISSKITSQHAKSIRLRSDKLCPYRELLAFREEDEPYFYGRETFTLQLVDIVHRKPLVAVIGSSGSGKSSVVFAGLLPQLRKEGDWLITSFRPSNRPFRPLSTALMSLLEPQMSERQRLLESNELAEQLRQGKLTLQDVVERVLQKQAGKCFLLVIDQFEELYTLCREQAVCERFLDELISIEQIASRNDFLSTNIVLTLRADFLKQALQYRPFADSLQYASLFLPPMNAQELESAIRKPAQMLGMKIEDGLAERIVNEVQQGKDRLPLLEFALTQLWAKKQNRILTHEAYKEIGGVEKALTDYVEKVYGKLNKDEQKRVQQIFVQLVRPGEETDDTRRLARRSEIEEADWNLVVRLSNARLVITGQDETTGEETVELIHEALIKGWQRLREWIEVKREFRLWQERLRTRMREWERTNLNFSELLRGAMLAESINWLTEPNVEITQGERSFIRASQEQQEQERKRQELLATLFSALQVSSSLLNITELLLWLVETVAKLVDVGLCTFFQLMNEGKELVAQAIYDSTGKWNAVTPRGSHEQHEDLIKMIRLPFKNSILGKLVEADTFFYLDTTLIDELAEISSEGGAIFLREMHSHKMLMLPVRYQSELVGILAVHTPQQYRVFLPEEVSTLLAIAGQAASAIRNVQLFEQLQVANAELQLLDKLKDEFIVTASHELRTPLSAISGYASMLKRQSARIDSQQALRYATKISGATQQLTDMVTQMTDAARVGAVDKKLELQVGPVQVLAAAEIASTMLSVNIEQTITVQIDPDLWVKCDGLHLRQVMTNLLDNAAKYSPPSGQIVISASATTLSQLPEGQVDSSKLVHGEDPPVVLVRVRDEGEGILLEDQGKIFEKFVRGFGSLVKSVRGSGLGLFICRRYYRSDGRQTVVGNQYPWRGVGL